MNVVDVVIMHLNSLYFTLDTLCWMTWKYCLAWLYGALLWLISLRVIALINQLKKLEYRSGFTVLSHGYFHW